MWRCLSMTVLVGLALAGPARAETRPPETLLAENSIFYLRFDGLEPHRKAYELTALSQVFHGDAGAFLDHLAQMIQNSLGPNVVKTRLLEGLPPAQLVKVQQAANQVPALRAYLGKYGFVAGFELIGMLPPRAQGTLVFPHGGTAPHREALHAVFQLVTLLNNVTIEETKQGDRTIYSFKDESAPVKVSWWVEGEHMVCTIGTEKPDHTLGLIQGDKPRANLTTSPLYKNVSEFKEYETVVRGFIDIERLVKLGRAVAFGMNPLGPVKNPYIDGLGLADLKSLNLYLGFSGKFQRSTLVFNTTKERQGLLRLLSGGTDVSLDRLPALPPDASGATILHIDPGEVYDVIRHVAEMAAGKEKDKVEAAFREVDLTLGVDLRKDLLANLDSTVVVYNSPGEAMFGLGAGIAIHVKNPEKFKESLDIASKAILSLADANTRWESRDYRGTEMHTLHQEQRNGFPFAFSYGLHKDWLVLGPYPHTVQGFILRSEGKVSAFKPTPLMGEVLAAAKSNPKNKVLLISESDPRVSLKQLASFSPFFLQIVDAFGGEFDPTLIPNYQAVTEPLFPNVAIVVDQGDAIRFDTHASLGLPFDPIGLEVYWFGLFIVSMIG